MVSGNGVPNEKEEGEPEVTKWVGVVVAALALAASALAGGRKEQAAPKNGSGVFVSATPKPGAGTFEMKVALDNEGEKVFELPAEVAVMYLEKNGLKRVRMVRVVGGKHAPEAKGNAQMVQGTITKAEVQGALVVLTIKTGEGDAATEQQLPMSSRIEIAYHEDAGKLIVQHISAAARREKGEKGAKPERRGKGAPANDPPENF
jgi:hypothetical protein